MTLDVSNLPLGAHADAHGVHFSIASLHATAIDLCLFDSADDLHETRRVSLTRGANGTWQSFMAGMRAGQLYAYRAHGPYAPQDGLRFNPCKLLLDPYARMITGDFQWHDAVHGYVPGDPQTDLSFNPQDSAPFVPRCVVAKSSFDWQGDHPPCIPWSETVIYECHLKGMSAQHAEVPPELRGTYLGLASPPIIDHLRRLGITAVELLPVHHSLSAKHLVAHRLTNYWGYDTVGFFAPDTRFARRPQNAMAEFQEMVRTMHRAGIEVILDVVYNHTFEGDHTGPTICWRGLDNSSYYHLQPHERRAYQNYTGCGNALNASNPLCRQMILDSLRYWVEVMHVDGFRLDLASTLTRRADGTPGDMSLFEQISADPILSQIKLIAEPWDVGPDGYRLGHGPAGWAEWNDRYRDAVRRYWRGEAGLLGQFATRIAGSSDYFPPVRRKAWCSVNFVTCHDGFTLRDLVSYERKHNDDNLENNRDGTDQNFSLNGGVEGPTEGVDVISMRQRLQRSFLATLLLSRGTPMLLAGDELNRTQHGNNNAYPQDNPISWLDWGHQPRRTVDSSARQPFARHGLVEFVRHLVDLRRRIGPCADQLFMGIPDSETNHKDVTWLRPDGGEMSHDNWHEVDRRALALLIRTKAGDSPSTWYVACNAHTVAQRFHLPQLVARPGWVRLLNTAYREQRSRTIGRADFTLRAHCVFVARKQEE